VNRRGKELTLPSLKRPSWNVGGRPAPVRLVPRDGEPEPDDAALVRGLAASEDWAARTAWNRYSPMVYGLLDRALGSAGESEDLTQEVFWRVFAAVHTLRDPNALRSFIYSAAIRMLRWHLRGKRIRRLLMLSDSGDLPERASPAQDARALAEGRELLVRFYRLLDRLGADDRTAFVLRHVEELSLEEISRATGASLATVKRRVRRASQQVAVLVKEEPDLVPYFVRAGGTHEA
jgi:RNA polymerase sigma-70 factor, ECF subfamily